MEKRGVEIASSFGFQPYYGNWNPWWETSSGAVTAAQG
jgi:hypothetical protein